jgi:hypothetical protein
MISSVNSKTCEISEPGVSLSAFLSLTWALPGRGTLGCRSLRGSPGPAQGGRKSLALVTEDSDEDVTCGRR